jgi:hypothetical protein
MSTIRLRYPKFRDEASHRKLHACVDPYAATSCPRRWRKFQLRLVVELAGPAEERQRQTAVHLSGAEVLKRVGLTHVREGCSAIRLRDRRGGDLVFFRKRTWEQLVVNISIVLTFGAFYLRFLREP